jgi:BirA family transcriptional regulator, biotin operon repressor / biotin---[acetyl-CoA-carboxylase] ligase
LRRCGGYHGNLVAAGRPPADVSAVSIGFGQVFENGEGATQFMSTGQSYIRYQISTMRPALRPFHLHWFPRLRSTNDHAAVMRKRAELFAPAIVLTGHQLAGRGRGSNTWWSGPGGLTVTFAIAANETIAPQQVPLLAGLAVRNAAAELTGDAPIQLKWPNDLLFEDRKLAGLLCERLDRVDLIGLGLNINMIASEPPRALRGRVTSLSQIVGRPLDQSAVLAAIARHLYATLSRTGERPFAEALTEYNRHHSLVGRRIAVTGTPGEPRIDGVCRGMDPTGRLVVRCRDGIRHIIAGHVSILP